MGEEGGGGEGGDDKGQHDKGHDEGQQGQGVNEGHEKGREGVALPGWRRDGRREWAVRHVVMPGEWMRWAVREWMVHICSSSTYVISFIIPTPLCPLQPSALCSSPPHIVAGTALWWR